MRLCKGIYVEPAEIAYRDFEAIRSNFVRVLDALWDAGCYVGIATHDEWLIEQAQKGIEERGLGREEYEFQMLLGVRPALGDELVRAGHRLRIYMPFGRTGTRTRCGGCRRTRRSRATSRRTRSTG